MAANVAPESPEAAGAEKFWELHARRLIPETRGKLIGGTLQMILEIAQACGKEAVLDARTHREV